MKININATQKKRVESLVKLMEKDKNFLVWTTAYPKGYKKPSKINASDMAMDRHLAAKLFIRRQKAAEKKRQAEKMKAEQEQKERYEKERKAENERRNKEKKAENQAMNNYARALFNNLRNAKNAASIRKAYLKGVVKLHPNKGGPPELFKKFHNLYNKKRA